MTLPVFHADRSLFLGGSAVTLDGPEGHHAAAVRRLSSGERLLLTDGAGALAECLVREAARDALLVDVVRSWTVPAPSPRLTVVQALPKGDRGETAVETLTEVGVDVVVPWAAARCVTKWRDARGERALERWRSTAREAAKQARRAHWPQVTPLATSADVAALLREATLAVVLHEEAAPALAATAVPSDGDVVLVVGPEGGIADDELEAFAAAGAIGCRLGPTVLRTSTAGTAAAAVVLARTRRWAGPGAT